MCFINLKKYSILISVALVMTILGCSTPGEQQKQLPHQTQVEHDATGSKLPECSNSVIEELISGKVLDKDGLASTAGIKGASSSTFVVGGVADAVQGVVKSSAGNFLMAFMPATARLSEIDHLAVVLNKFSTNSREDAIAKMRLDITEVTRDVVNATDVVVNELKRSYSYSLTGGYCAPIACKIHSGFLGTKSNLPKLDAQGNYVFSTTFGASKNGERFFENNPKHIAALAQGLGKRGYLVGFWSAHAQLIYSESGELCRVALASK